VRAERELIRNLQKEEDELEACKLALQGERESDRERREMKKRAQA
jgi:hypothetical protein